MKARDVLIVGAGMLGGGVGVAYMVPSAPVVAPEVKSAPAPQARREESKPDAAVPAPSDYKLPPEAVPFSTYWASPPTVCPRETCARCDPGTVCESADGMTWVNSSSESLFRLGATWVTRDTFMNRDR